jgi:hypothetical protein
MFLHVFALGVRLIIFPFYVRRYHFFALTNLHLSQVYIQGDQFRVYSLNRLIHCFSYTSTLSYFPLLVP